jgi:nucleoside-diphosphate-sugar epimerase
MKNVVVIGGAGRVAGMLMDRVTAEHRVRVVDRDPQAPVPAGVERMIADVTAPESMAPALEGQDVLLYLAMGALHGGSVEHGAPLDGPWATSHFDVNVKGLYFTLKLAAAAGVQHVVYASSLSIFEDYLAQGHELDTLAPDAVDGYGLTKRLGEEVCRAAVTENGMDVTALRLCGPLPDEEWQTWPGGRCEVMTAGSDVAEAFAAAIRVRPEGFQALTVTGDHAGRFLDWSRTREVLGWEPRARR